MRASMRLHVIRKQLMCGEYPLAGVQMRLFYFLFFLCYIIYVTYTSDGSYIVNRAFSVL